MKIFSSSMFNSAEELADHAKYTISAENSSQSLVYNGVSIAWSKIVLDRLDQDPNIGRPRLNYNSGTQRISICTMPTRIHDCHQDWYGEESLEWIGTGLITIPEGKHLHHGAGTTYEFTSGPYAGSRKEPDFLIEPDDLSFPTLVIESRWPESLSQLEEDMNLWLVGGNGNVKAVIIMNWETLQNTDQVKGMVAGRHPVVRNKILFHTDQVKGDVYLYCLDSDGIPVLQQSEVVFPSPPPAQAQAQEIRLTKGMFFGKSPFPNIDHNDILPLRLDTLRTCATRALDHMGLIPSMEYPCPGEAS